MSVSHGNLLSGFKRSSWPFAVVRGHPRSVTCLIPGSFYMSLDKWECQRHILSEVPKRGPHTGPIDTQAPENCWPFINSVSSRTMGRYESKIIEATECSKLGPNVMLDGLKQVTWSSSSHIWMPFQWNVRWQSLGLSCDSLQGPGWLDGVREVPARFLTGSSTRL